MKKKIYVLICVIVVILIYLVLPTSTNLYDDGGTKTYDARLYKVVVWNHIVDEDTIYTKTSVYWYPDNQKSLDELWIIENK